MDLYMTADEAAAALAVDVKTLYTYVSRKKLRTLRVAGERQSRYWRADVEQLAGTSTETIDSSPLVPTTKITLITPEGPFYRGHSAIELAEHATLEEVATILWQVKGAFAPALPKLPGNYSNMAAMVAELDTAERAAALLPLVEQRNPKSYDFSTAGYARTGADVVRLYASIVAGTDYVSDAPVHEFMGKSLGLSEPIQDLVRRLLVLGADHELDPTTYAVRALANTGVTPYAVASVGLAAFRGRRLRMGRTELVLRLIDEVVEGTDPETPILERFRNGESLPGFGSGVYRDRDPRATALFRAFDELIPDDSELRRLKCAMAVAHDLTGAEADFILASAFLRRKLGERRDNISIVAVGRLVGWIAHAMEQFEDTPLIRPRAAFVGHLPRDSG